MSPRHGNENMDISMDKPIALNRTEGTRGPQVEKSKNEVSKICPVGMGMKVWTCPWTNP